MFNTKINPINGWTKEKIKARLREHVRAERCLANTRNSKGDFHCAYESPTDPQWRCAVGAFLDKSKMRSVIGDIYTISEEFPELRSLLPLSLPAMEKLQFCHDECKHSSALEACLEWVDLYVEDVTI